MKRHPLPAACLLLVLALAAVLAGPPVPPTADVWAHAAVGRWTWEHGEVPRHTLFLWSASVPWVAHSWLSGLLFFGLLSAGGAGLVRVVAAVTVAATFALPWRLWARRAAVTAWTAFLFSLGLWAASDRFQPRAELFTALFCTVLLLYLLRRTDAPPVPARRAWLGAAGVAVLFVVWTNAHGAVAVGLALLATTAVCDLLQDRFDRRSRALALLTLACAAATLVNPYGPGYWQALRPVGGTMFHSVAEWRPFWQVPAHPTEKVVALGLLAGAALVAWLRSARRRWSQLAWLLGTAAAFLTARRHAGTLVLVSLTVIAAHADALDPRALWQARRGAGDTRPGRGAWLAFAAVTAWVLLLMTPAAADWLDPPSAPDGAVGFIRDNRLDGRLLNDYETSGYLEWRLAGRPPLFIDLLNAYPDQLMRDWDEMVLFTPRAKALLDERDVGCVVLSANIPVPLPRLPLVQFLLHSPAWALVYHGEDAAVWVRRTAEYEYLWRNALPPPD
jgi:hypothetical protein